MEISGAGAGALAILPAIAAGDWCCTGTIAWFGQRVATFLP